MSLKLRLRMLTIALLACAPDSHESTRDARRDWTEESRPQNSAPIAGEAGFCGDGWYTIEDGACVALPGTLAKPPSLVVYAHGILAPDALPSEEQRVLLAAAQELGFAVLFGRGQKGLCTWDPSVADHLCWPTKQHDVDAFAPEIVSGWSTGQSSAERLAGEGFERRYLFGFSNGGYFVAFLSSEGRLRVDGAGIVGAGRTTVDEALLATEHPPLYLAVGEEEAEVTRQDAANLAGVLTARSWPLKYVVHPGRGHELYQDDLVAAWAAWGR
jgi:hypothetical protein